MLPYSFMIHLPEQTFEQFYAPLVGTEANIDLLRRGLTASVRSYRDQDNFHSTDPFSRLLSGLSTTMLLSTARVDGLSKSQSTSVFANGAFAGTLVVNALRAVGDIYASRATVPQKADVVQKSTDRVLRHVFGIAFAGPTVGSYNLEALNLGLNPRNPLAVPALALASSLPFIDFFTKGRRTISKRSFIVDEDEMGQLDIAPRYHRVKWANGRHCPAADKTVEVCGKTRSALFTFMRTVGSVAVAEIYPYFFHIEEAASEAA